MTKAKITLLLILLLAGFLRFWQLADLPSILNRDEAALAYNAKLLVEAGRDEWGQTWPLTFKSFGDYKLPGYIYTLTGLFAFLPMQDFVVRLPSALAGLVLVFVIYLFSRQVLRLEQRMSLFASLLTAVLPVFSFYSRIAFEANLALTLLLTALYLLLRERPRDILGVLLLALAVATYNTPLLLLPFFIPLLIWWRGARQPRQWFLPVLAIFFIGFTATFLLQGLQSQKSAITIFADPTIWQEFVNERQELSGLWQTVLGNQYFFYLRQMGERFVDSLSLEFLVRNGGAHPWHSIPAFGHIFYVMYFFALAMLIDIVGEIFFALSDEQWNKLNKLHLLLLYLLLAALAPAVVTVDSPHATRSLLFFVILVYLSVLFLDRLVKVFKKYDKPILFIFLFILAIESSIYYHAYFTRYPQQQPAITWPSFKEEINIVEREYKDRSIVIHDEEGYQYILAAWYLQMPSSDYFSTIKYQAANQIGLHYGEKLTHYRFIAHPDDRMDFETVLLSRNMGIIDYAQ